MMDQHTAPIVAINNENIVPTVKNNTISLCGICFMKMEDLVICKAFISTSKDPISGTFQNESIFDRQRCISLRARGAYLLKPEVHIFESKRCTSFEARIEHEHPCHTNSANTAEQHLFGMKEVLADMLDFFQCLKRQQK